MVTTSEVLAWRPTPESMSIKEVVEASEGFVDMETFIRDKVDLLG